ncbi:MAG: hypothetical protein WBD55_06415 [Dehalococcoidia bacterium]
MSSSARILLIAFCAAAGAALFAVACGGGEKGEPEDFAKFADTIATAVAAGDVAFFADRIASTPYTCSQEEVDISTGPDAPGQPICTEVGYTFNSVYIQDYPGETQTTLVRVLKQDFQKFFKDALPKQSDQYGPGSVRLYATGASLQPPATGRDVHSAILAEIQHTPVGVIGRTVRGIDFEYVAGRWVIVGESASTFPTAAEFLEPSSAAPLYANWARYGE